jgi:hypothetical protein
MQRNTTFFIAVKAVHVSSVFPAHHQELKNCTYSLSYLLSFVAATPSVAPDDEQGNRSKHVEL